MLLGRNAWLTSGVAFPSYGLCLKPYKSYNQQVLSCKHTFCSTRRDAKFIWVLEEFLSLCFEAGISVPNCLQYSLWFFAHVYSLSLLVLQLSNPETTSSATGSVRYLTKLQSNSGELKCN